jgi:hypothetical protein
MKRKTTLVVVGVIVQFSMVGCSLNRTPDWGLPIKLGQTSKEVRLILGKPTEIVDTKTMKKYEVEWEPDYSLEYFYSAGIVARFEQKVLFGITINTFSDYPGFLIYSGAIVNGVKVSDTKKAILAKLGTPTKVEDHPLEVDVDPNIPAVFPKSCTYYWRFENFTVQIDILNQAQNIDEKKGVTRLKDAISLVQVYR